MRALTLMALVVAGASMADPDGARAEPAGPPRPIVVIVPSGSDLDSVSVDSLRRIYIGDVPELRPLNLPPGSAERSGFDRAVLGLGPDEAARFWIDRKIRGQRGAPKAIPSGALMARIVARIPGTIGYLSGGPLPPGVKVVRVNGLPPGHPRYPLQATSSAR